MVSYHLLTECTNKDFLPSCGEERNSNFAFAMKPEGSLGWIFRGRPLPFLVNQTRPTPDGRGV